MRAVSIIRYDIDVTVDEIEELAKKLQEEDKKQAAAQVRSECDIVKVPLIYFVILYFHRCTKVAVGTRACTLPAAPCHSIEHS